jgi:hypothetical protein
VLAESVAERDVVVAQATAHKAPIEIFDAGPLLAWDGHGRNDVVGVAEHPEDPQVLGFRDWLLPLRVEVSDAELCKDRHVESTNVTPQRTPRAPPHLTWGHSPVSRRPCCRNRPPPSDAPATPVASSFSRACDSAGVVRCVGGGRRRAGTTG